MNEFQLLKNYIATSDRQLVLNLVHLAKYKYLLADNFYLINNLSYFVFNAVEKNALTNSYSFSTVEIMSSLFKTEITFAKEAIRYMEDYLHHPLATTDYLVLAELVIAANCQLNVNSHEQENYLQLIHSLTTRIAFHVNLSRSSLFAEAPRLMRHIKYLALRIIKEKFDSLDSDNELYFYVMKNYPRDFYTANHLRAFITENFDFDLSNDEISYLVLHFHRLNRDYKIVVKE
ncbi:PRD domain-containing protein [Enterococcus raffinosus]|uniref:PRD domain-containing protein n=1 Tax=Enterococcus raffinosus TaxID=71452 RepID=A0AAW8TE12_9ENTE|nr:PRD domain-containing protein [Enterococcus raffinosus]MDT2524565.1 PRD domain-containing protein [Enterococcus raffinosus]MDT2530627.1 PRD domain-containing protein [Enterococcus raffinosus]MDT2534462.1 PRD domain-containing protein [Enterococcus raffinosus]MDT2546065.1 PRD domain-containing protein [Enterococcus raffinosus]MDT2555617.1 PRD domain-containing protein [Enterococcus raffinosus]